MLIYCPECENACSEQATDCPQCGHPLGAPTKSGGVVNQPSTPARAPIQKTEEYVLYESNPKMFRNEPITFVFCVLLVPFFGFGLLILGIWFLSCCRTRITVTNKRTTLHKGILSKHTSEVLHRQVQNIQIKQSFMQRWYNTGYVGLSTAGQSDVEVEVNGIPDPEKVHAIIDEHRGEKGSC